MTLSFDEVKAITRKFSEEYLFKKPYSDYVNGCGISKVGIRDKKAPEETRDDFCISVMLAKRFPKTVSLPKEYQGIRVFVEFVGVIGAL